MRHVESGLLFLNVSILGILGYILVTLILASFVLFVGLFVFYVSLLVYFILFFFLVFQDRVSLCHSGFLELTL